MYYLGGKSRCGLSKRIAKIVNAERAGRGGWPFWEPFCGGLSVSRRLAAGGPGIVSDVSAPLIALYRAVRDGWDPPAEVSREVYQAARALPDSDPFKAFAGFGCSFGGKWFGGYAQSRRLPSGRVRSYAQETRDAVRRDVGELGAAGCAIERLDFLSITPRPLEVVIYADPPYAGTTGYAACAGAFDHARFWAVCQAWARAGVPVFVSEYACPAPHDLMFEVGHELKTKGGAIPNARTERLFRVHP